MPSPLTREIIIARRLYETPRILVASPEYLERKGTPKRLKDLSDHDCEIFTTWAPQSTWTLHERGRRVQVRIRGRVIVNHLDSAKHAALDGFGITQLVRSACASELRSGVLEEVLPGTCPFTGALWAIYPSKRHLLPTVRAFVEYFRENIREHLGLAPDEAGS